MRIPPLLIGILCVVIILLFAPIIVNMLAHGNDYPAHIQAAIVLEETGNFRNHFPHFLYHILLVLLNRVIPSQYAALAASVLGLLCYLVVGFIIFRLVHPLFYRLPSRIRWFVPILLTVALMLLGPINIFTWQEKHLSFGYLVPYSYHNPTVILLRPFALALFFIAIRAFTGIKTNLWSVIFIAILAALSTMAKPNFGIAFVPALALVIIYFWYRKYPIDWRLLTAIIVPIVVILCWQFVFFTGQVTGGFEFAPLKVALGFSRHNLVFEFLVSVGFPAVVYILYFQHARRNLMLNLAWLVFTVAALYAYLLALRIGWQAGDFFWGTEVTLMILIVVSTFYFIQHNLNWLVNYRWNWRIVTCIAFFTLHLIGGIAIYLSSLGPGWRDWL